MDSWDVKNLRTVVPHDLEENHTYKRIGREAIRAAIEHRQISPEEYIRPQRSAVAHEINQRLVFEYQQYLQQPFSILCSDLKSCYYRIFHSAAILALQCLGIPLPSIFIILYKIQRM